jgi:hypothetical protein
MFAAPVLVGRTVQQLHCSCGFERERERGRAREGEGGREREREWRMVEGEMEIYTYIHYYIYTYIYIHIYESTPKTHASAHMLSAYIYELNQHPCAEFRNLRVCAHCMLILVNRLLKLQQGVLDPRHDYESPPSSQPRRPGGGRSRCMRKGSTRSKHKHSMRVCEASLQNNTIL